MASEIQKTLSTVFMVEPGPLETQSYLLVQSLLLHCQDTFQMVAYCRDHLIEALQPTTVDMLRSAGVQLVPITNPFDDGYPAGNKIVVAEMDRETDWTVILDTDTFLVRPARFLSQAEENCICVCPANRNAWTEVEDIWTALYGMFDLERPAKDFALASGTLSYPFYNAGMIMFSGPYFGSTWMETSCAVDANSDIRKKRPWLDQISLPVAIERTTGQTLKLLNRRWNDTPDLPNDETKLLHYHRPRRLQATKKMHLADHVIAKSASEFQTFQDVVRHYEALGAVPNAKALSYER